MYSNFERIRRAGSFQSVVSAPATNAFIMSEAVRSRDRIKAVIAGLHRMNLVIYAFKVKGLTHFDK